MTIAACGVLLAAGSAQRFGGAKLVAPLRTGRDAGVPIAIAALRHLRQALGAAIVVLRAHDTELAALSMNEGATVVIAERASDGMGASLAAGVRAAPSHAGIVVALADMPWIEPTTIARVADAIATGALIAAPFHDGRRGHPVGFSPTLRDELLALTGDEGARSLLLRHSDALVRIDVDDPGVLRDVDTPSDLA